MNIENEQMEEREDNQFDEEGLESRLAKFTAGTLNETPKVEIPEGEEEQPIIATPPKKEETTTSEEEEEFPQLGKKKEQAKTSVVDDDLETDEEIKGMEPKAGEKWKLLKAELRKAKQEAEEAKAGSKVSPEIEAELVTLREKAAEAEALRKRNEELLKANDRIAVEESDEYHAKVKAPYAEMEKALKSLSDHAKIPMDSLIDLITEEDIAKQDVMIEELEGKIGARMAGRIGRIADDYKAVTETKARLLENSKQTLEQSRITKANAEREEKARSLRAYQVSSDQAFKEYAHRIPSFVDSTGNLTELAKDIMAKTSALDPSTLDSSDLGYMAFCANSFPEARKTIVNLQKEITMLKASQGNRTIEGSAPGKKADPEDPEIGLGESMKSKTFYFKAP
jgi:hypothetical protein